jgi:tight adherence protein B
VRPKWMGESPFIPFRQGREDISLESIQEGSKVMSMDILIAVGIFLVILAMIEGGYVLFQALRNPEKKKVRTRLMNISSAGLEVEESGLERQVMMSEVPWLNRILLKLDWSRRMNLLLEQAGIRRPVGVFLLLSLVLAGIGFIIGLWMISSYLAAALFAAVLGALPFIYILSKKRRRMQKFERQLPEALDLIARSLKAGHAFTGGLKMVADEMDDPIGTEFDKTLAEINFGIDVQAALKNFARRVDCPDIRFFVISVILQRETGGNLAEILENIAYLIRERFKLHGRIRVLSAEGKFSALVLVALPFVIIFALSFLNPDYLRILITDPIGKFMVAFAAAMMVLGILVMKKMVAIKV